LDTSVRKILDAVKAEDYTIYLTSQDKSNFRLTLDPSYKANRTAPKPPYYLLLREYMIQEHKAEVAFGMEADDLLGINQTEDTVICSIDKDLKQIAGRHYNFVKDEHCTVSISDGLYWFYTQLLTGDPSDNIKGVAGIGPKRATIALGDPFLVDSLSRRIKGPASIEAATRHYLAIIVRLYAAEYPLSFREKICCNGALLKIKDQKNEPIWHPTNYITEADWKLLSQIP
jgi:5'-3' exonuclease